MPKDRSWISLFVLFGAGTLTGIMGTGLYYDDGARTCQEERGPVAQRDQVMKRLVHELSLTATQQTDIDPIDNRVHLAILELRFAHQSEIEEILTHGITDMSTTLSPDQQDELAEMYGRLQYCWQRSRKYIADAKKTLNSQPSELERTRQTEASFNREHSSSHAHTL